MFSTRDEVCASLHQFLELCVGRRYMSKFQVPVCYPEFSKQNILPTGAVASTATCKSPYDSLGGSAVYWCAAHSHWGLDFRQNPEWLLHTLPECQKRCLD